jgi:hypothetical protein
VFSHNPAFYSPWTNLDLAQSRHQTVATLAKTARMSKLDHRAFSSVNDMIHSPHLRRPARMVGILIPGVHTYCRAHQFCWTARPLYRGCRFSESIRQGLPTGLDHQSTPRPLWHNISLDANSTLLQCCRRTAAAAGPRRSVAWPRCGHWPRTRIVMTR